MAALLTLSACGDDVEEPEVLEPGPLRLRPATTCTMTDDNLLIGSKLENTADIALTIDDVGVFGTGIHFVGATLGEGVPAIDATMLEAGHPDAEHVLVLELSAADPSAASTSRVTVDYHNVEGRFQAVADGVDLKTLCGP